MPQGLFGTVRLHALSAMGSFGNFLDKFAAEGGQVVRSTTCDQSLIDDHRLIDHLRTRIPQIEPNGRPARKLAVLHQSRVDQDPRRVADRTHGLARIGKLTDEFLYLRSGAQLIRILRAARKHDGVVIVGAGMIELLVDMYLLVGFHVMETLYLARFRRNDLDLSAFLFQRFHGSQEFRFFESVGGENGDLLSLKPSGHSFSPARCLGGFPNLWSYGARTASRTNATRDVEKSCRLKARQTEHQAPSPKAQNCAAQPELPVQPPQRQPCRARIVPVASITYSTDRLLQDPDLSSCNVTHRGA